MRSTSRTYGFIVHMGYAVVNGVIDRGELGQVGYLCAWGFGFN